MPTMNELRAASLYDQYNQHESDVDWLKNGLTLMTEDVVLESPFGVLTGKQQVGEYYRNWSTSFRGSRVTVQTLKETDDGAVEVVFVGEGDFNGPMSTPNGVISPNGNHLRLEVNDLVTFRGDKISNIKTSFDIPEMLHQLELTSL